MTTKQIDATIAQVTGLDLSFSSCLNAMREAWFNVIFPKPSLCLEYYQNLCTVVETKKDGAHIFGVCLYDKVTNATAAQRAEAFLRTIGKWEE